MCTRPLASLAPTPWAHPLDKPAASHLVTVELCEEHHDHTQGLCPRALPCNLFHPYSGPGLQMLSRDGMHRGNRCTPGTALSL